MLLKMKHNTLRIMEEYCSSMKWSIGKIGICTLDPLWGVSDKYPVTLPFIVMWSPNSNRGNGWSINACIHDNTTGSTLHVTDFLVAGVVLNSLSSCTPGRPPVMWQQVQQTTPMPLPYTGAPV